MTTTDSNGLIQYQTTDNVVPLQTAFNGLSSSVSTALNSTVRTFKVANDTERNALATTRVPSATNPLVVFNSASGKGYHEINTGSGWSKWIPANAVSSNTANSRIQSGTITATRPASGSNTSNNVTFATPFTSVPTIQVSVDYGRLSPSYSNLTTTGFTFITNNWTSSVVSGTFVGQWMAVGPVAS